MLNGTARGVAMEEKSFTFLETYPLAVCAAMHQQIVQPTTMEDHYENKTL
jgi:hypothetical protein